MPFIYKLIKTDAKTTIPFKKKLPFEEEPMPVWVDESTLQQPLDLYKMNNVDVSLPPFTDDSLFDAFEKALSTYVNWNPETFFAFYDQLPSLKSKNIPDFLNVQFEELFKIPVRVRSADIMMIKIEMNEGHVDSIKQIQEKDNFNQARTMMSFSFDSSTLFVLPPLYNPDTDFLPVFPPVPNDKPITPTITLTSENTQNMNREALILSQEGSVLTGNIFENGASFGMAGGGTISLSFFQPVRPGSTLITNTPGQVTIITPEENSLVLYTATSLDHQFGDFAYNLIAPIFTPPEPFFMQSGSKVFVDKFRYTLIANDLESSTGLLQVQIIDDIPSATPKENQVNETLYFVNGNETAMGNLVYDDDGFGPSSFGADGGFVSRINGITTIIGDTITAPTTYGSIVVYAHDNFPNVAGDYVYSLDGSKTSPVNDALLEVEDIITYRLTDNDGNTASSTLTITITLNQPPQAVDDNYSIGQGQILIIDDLNGVLPNDIVSPGDTKAVIEINGNIADVGVQVNLPSGALLTMDGDGSFDYDPNGLVDGQSDDFTYTLEEAEGLTSQAQVHIDITLPIILDLTGRGFEFVTLENSNTTWLFPDGQNYKVAWSAPELGVLVYDENQNGLVDGLNEFSFSLYDLFAKSDLEGLKYFDSDDNDLLDQHDAQFEKFAVWLDLNRNGKSDPGELLALKDLGITSIELQSDGQYKVIDDAMVFGVGHFHNADGTTGNFADVAFRVGGIVSEVQWMDTIAPVELLS